MFLSWMPFSMTTQKIEYSLGIDNVSVIQALALFAWSAAKIKKRQVS